MNGENKMKLTNDQIKDGWQIDQFACECCGHVFNAKHNVEFPEYHPPVQCTNIFKSGDVCGSDRTYNYEG